MYIQTAVLKWKIPGRQDTGHIYFCVLGEGHSHHQLPAGISVHYLGAGTTLPYHH